MLQKYKEIFFGLIFGVVAVVIDLAMDAAAEGNSLMDELAEHPGIMFYRLIFILLGLVLGWLLWRGNRAERESRQLKENLRSVRQQCGTQGLLIGASLQKVLTHSDPGLSEEAQGLLREVYQRSRELQTLAEGK
jgi:hypothetical protein